MKVKINIRLEEDLIKRLKNLEKATDIRVAVHVTKALTEYLNRRENSDA